MDCATRVTLDACVLCIARWVGVLRMRLSAADDGSCSVDVYVCGCRRWRERERWNAVATRADVGPLAAAGSLKKRAKAMNERSLVL